MLTSLATTAAGLGGVLWFIIILACVVVAVALVIALIRHF